MLMLSVFGISIMGRRPCHAVLAERHRHSCVALQREPQHHQHRQNGFPAVHRRSVLYLVAPSVASAVNANGAFWFCTYEGALNAELFVELLRQMMRSRKKRVHLVLDSLPAHKKAIVHEYVGSTNGR